MALQCGCRTVREAGAHDLAGAFLRTVLFQELVPAVTRSGSRDFAALVLERFANPHIEHSLQDVMLQVTAKFRARVVPSP